MRRLMVEVPSGEGDRVLGFARELGGVNLARWPVRDDREAELLLVHLDNRRVGEFLQRLEAVPDHRVTLEPQGVLALHPPPDQTPGQVTSVQRRSGVEVYLSGLQAIGSWSGFLAYAAVSGVVVWVGLVTETVYLLVGAMLIAPFAGPATNAAIGTARGDARLLGRTVLRYWGGILTGTLVSALLTLAWPGVGVTGLMGSVGAPSPYAPLLPLVAGVAAALHLTQSDRNSLVSGAGVGLLVSAALAPPAGVLGAGMATGRFDLALGSLYQLALQFFGIHVAATVTFRRLGLQVEGPRYVGGSERVYRSVLAATLVALVALVAAQAAGFIPP